jgi:hypothetical protein
MLSSFSRKWKAILTYSPPTYSSPSFNKKLIAMIPPSEKNTQNQKILRSIKHRDQKNRSDPKTHDDDSFNFKYTWK